MSRERNRKLELALKHELRKTSTPVSEPALRSFSEGGCVDAETLGAWADGGLDAVQMTAVELHVATCVRCQEILGATARSAPVPLPTEVPAGSSLWKWWLAPIAAGAAAMTLWMVVPEETMQAPPAAPVSVIEANKDTPGEPQTRERQAAAGAAPAGLDDRQGRRDTFLERKQEDRAADQAAIGAVAATPPPAPARSADSSGLAAAGREATLQTATGTTATLEIVSPDSRRRWRVNGASIEHSEDSGATWVGVHQVDGETLTGGTAPTRTVCWLIGTNGVVLVTADGTTFSRASIPERVALTAITAIDARSATVTAADGRQFLTDDAGRSWRRN